MKQYPSRMGVGASSILLILVVVSLTLFASLALFQARADAALTEKTDVSVTAFYEADVRAQAMLAQLDDALLSGESIAQTDGVLQQDDGIYLFSIDSSDGHTLRVVVDVSGGRCEIMSYRYENAQDWANQSTGTLWQGG